MSLQTPVTDSPPLARRTTPPEVTVTAADPNAGNLLQGLRVVSTRPAGVNLFSHHAAPMPAPDRRLRVPECRIREAAVVMTAAQNHREFPTPNNGHASHDDSTRSMPARTVVPRSRTGGLWVAAVVFAVVLLLLLIFVLQNGQRVNVSFLGADGQLPLGVALLLAAVFGVLLVALPGTARIVQLRMLSHRRDPSATGPPTGPVPLPPDDPAHRQTDR